ncbi:hypothetical protein H4CHR_02967 [Variovorax sp. PBS-H4]|uniref:hypothetical protein n=1 Tax=Variovorax sp. PBS-H4 TaxID=434008 RepID=UPI0013189801|nr:hypothetical protein [Variovorax sp. PBS-H4]VTU32217.1 hypothetical protein H4CHR_02967 [Variovorax sp. PBS-H4]
MALPALPPASAGGSSRKVQATHSLQIDLTGMPVTQLLELRALIDEKLPVKDLKDIDLNRELVLQMLQTQQLQANVLKEDETPANQRAQVANAVAGIISQLAQLQAKVYTSERLKRIETALIDTLQELPKEAQNVFLERYEVALKDV